jgi:tRNA A-37 threonylcarbamoyl transferase component Bud32
MAVLSFSCPECGKPLKLTSPLASGKRTRCPHCQHTFVPRHDSPQATLDVPAGTQDKIQATPACTLSLEGNVPVPGKASTLSLPPDTRCGPKPIPPETLDDLSSQEQPTALPEGTPERIGRFLIRRALGEGAFGIVYQAHDPQLDRLVALKVAKLGRGDADQRVKRFMREAKAAANLRHPHIVPVYEYGQDGEQFYIASAFIQGHTLAEEMKNCLAATPQGSATSIPFDRTARIVRAMAEALAYAHSQGIIHRDVKPLNTMLDDKDQPLIMDFGLAAREDDEKLNREGAAMGTAAYMAPGQAEGNAVAASDQYSLGCTLYEMLTGQTPFSGPWDVQIFNHLHTEPSSPRKVNGTVPRDLETISLKCLAKRPGERYGTCQELADDLRRFSEGEPIQARRIGLLERAGKWCRKNPLSAGLVGAVAASLVLGTGIAWSLAGWALQEAGEAKYQTKLAKDNETFAKDNLLKALINENLAKENEVKTKEALADVKKQKKMADDNYNLSEWRFYATNIALAKEAWQDNNFVLAQHYLDQSRWDFRGWEHDYLWTQLKNRQTILQGHMDYVTSIAFSPDGQRIASGSWDNTLKVWDAASGQATLTLRGHTGVVSSVAFSPDGKRIVSGSEDNTLKVWDAASGQATLTLRGHTDAVSSVAFSPDGQRIVGGSRDNTLKVWPLEKFEKRNSKIQESKKEE